MRKVDKAIANQKPVDRAGLRGWLVLLILLAAAAVLAFGMGWFDGESPGAKRKSRKQSRRNGEKKKRDPATVSEKPVETGTARVGEGGRRPRPVPSGMFRVAAIQFVSEWGKPEANREALSRLIRDAAQEGAAVVVMPEAAVPGYHSPDLQTPWRDPVRRTNSKDGRSLVEANVAETVPGASTRVFGELAKELRLRIVVSLIEKVEKTSTPGRIDYFNSAVLVGPDGGIECHYRKLHPWPIGEATWAQKGDKGLGVCKTEHGSLGMAICYDLSCGVIEKLKKAGVQTVLYPIGWVCSDARQWFDEMLPEKVKDWGVNLVGANWSLDAHPKGQHAWHGYGHSRIIAADGRVLARGKATGTEILYADLPIGKAGDR